MLILLPIFNSKILIINSKKMKTLVAIVALILGTTIGVYAQTKTMVKISDLPQNVTSNLNMQHKDWRPIEAFKIDTKGVMSYEVIARKDKEEVRFFYDKDGNYTKTENMMVKTSSSTHSNHERHNMGTSSGSKSSSSQSTSNKLK
jgi:hypothetical protein